MTKKGGNKLLREIEISSSHIHIADTQKCVHCLTINDIEKLYVAQAVVECPDLFTELQDDARGITSVEEASKIATRLILTAPQAQYICDACGQPANIKMDNKVDRKYLVAAEFECRCGRHYNLNYPRDLAKIRYTTQFHLPYVSCECGCRLLVTLADWQVWRSWVFGAMRKFTSLQEALGLCK